jgi:hypothetical protein
MLGLEAELLQLVTSVPAFSAPIRNAFNPAASVADARVKPRMAFSRVQQGILDASNFVPYLYWTGPNNYDKGQTSIGSSGTKKVDFWFHCCHNTDTQALAWAKSIENALDEYTLNLPQNLTTLRISAMIFLDILLLQPDQVLKTAAEYPTSTASIGYRFGYQSVSP